MIGQRNFGPFLGAPLSWHGILFCRAKRGVHGLLYLAGVEAVEAIGRGVDILLSLSLIALLSPLFAALTIKGLYRVGARSVLSKVARVGRGGSPFGEFIFTNQKNAILSRLPVLLNVIRGEMSLVGPRPISPGEHSFGAKVAGRRTDVRPGVVCSHWLQQRSSVDFDGESASDLLYVDTRSLKTDVGLMLRACIAASFGSRPAATGKSAAILNIAIDTLTMEEALDWIELTLAAPGDETREVCFVNPHCANVAWNDPEYRGILNSSHLRLPDGIGMVIGGKLAQSPIRQNVNGTDLFPRLCKRLEGTGVRVYLLGAAPGVAHGVANWIRKYAPGTELAGWADGFFSEAEQPAVIDRIRRSQADLLLVAMGVPRQEKWIRMFAAQTGVKVAMGVGGLFDFYSGRIPRAPQWVREIGMEWFYRFSQEPKRLFHRYFVGNYLFMIRILQQNAKARCGR